MNLNFFRLVGDLSHISSKCILIWAIHRNKSAEGVSLLTQMLYAAVFVTRYLDLFRAEGWNSFYLVSFKLFYILSSFYIIFLMMKVYPRTREREKAWKLALWSLGGSLVLAPILPAFYKAGYPYNWFTEIFWTFSIILESVCVLPQLLLLRQTTVPTVIDSYYLVTLGSYRGFYILNWLWRGFGKEHYWDPIAVIFGIVQTAFYLDFAWVYYSRQRVKLRQGGVVDSEDFSKSWLVNKVLNFRSRKSTDEEQVLHDGDVENQPGTDARPGNNRWGARGISISADDTLDNQSRPGHHTDDDGLEGILDDEDSGSDEQGPRKSSPVSGHS